MGKLMIHGFEASGSQDNAVNIHYKDSNVSSALDSVTEIAESNRQMITDEWTSKGYSKGDYVIYNNTLYVCILAHASGIVPTNTTYWKATNVGKEIVKYKDFTLTLSANPYVSPFTHFASLSTYLNDIKTITLLTNDTKPITTNVVNASQGTIGLYSTAEAEVTIRVGYIE